VRVAEQRLFQVQAGNSLITTQWEADVYSRTALKCGEMGWVEVIREKER
jgi:hypothetical protein